MTVSPGKFLPPLPLVLPAIVSGFFVTLAFPTVSWWWLSFVALVPLLVAVLRYRPSGREAFRTGFLMGLACYGTMLWWIIKLIPSADVTIPWLMTPALILLVVYLALYPAFFLLLLGWITRWRLGAVVAAAPPVWVLLELARSRGELAFPWGTLGYALSYHPSFVQTASWAGLPALSFLLVLANVLVAGLFLRGRTIRRGALLLGAVAVVVAMWMQGRAAIASYAEPPGPAVKVAVVQPNVDLNLKWKPEFKDSTFRLIERLTDEAVEEGAQIVIFPETCAPIYVNRDVRDRRRLFELARSTNTPIYIGFLDYHRLASGDVDVYNSSGLFLPDSTMQKYAKRHLLPFGEALPLAWKFRWLRKINFGQANFEPGPPRPPLDAGVFRFTPMICFESVFPYLCRQGVRRGAEVLVNITNDGWFNDTPGPFQHAQMAVLRAVEFRRYLLRSANTGVSMVVDPLGRIDAHIGLFKEGIVYADVHPSRRLTVYARTGDWPAMGVSLVLIILAALAARRRRRGEWRKARLSRKVMAP